MRIGLVVGAAALLALQLSLSGCSTVDSAVGGVMSAVGLGGSDDESVAEDSQPDQTAQVAPAPAPVASGWCQQVADQAKSDAAGNGFSADTQQRRYDVALSECASLSAQQ